MASPAKDSCDKLTSEEEYTKQVRTNNYFGDYIGKHQKYGTLEIQRCIEKWHNVKARQQRNSPLEQNRKVCGRMITDIEMKGTLRCAVEEYNLCTNATVHDVLLLPSHSQKDCQLCAWTLLLQPWQLLCACTWG